MKKVPGSLREIVGSAVTRLGGLSCALAVALVPLAAEAASARTLTPAAIHGAIVAPLPPATPLTLYIRLAGARDNEIDAIAAAVTTPGSPVYGRYLTPEAFGRYFGANARDYAAAIALLRASGFAIDELAENRTDIVAHASAAAIAAFFQTPIDLHLERGRTFFANRYEPVFPAGLHAVAVSGLDDYFVLHSMVQRPARSRLASFRPNDVAAAYDLNPLFDRHLDGKGVTIANATCGAATTSDFALFRSHFSLPPATLLSTARPKGSALSIRCGRGGDNSESSLDADWALAIAREATFHQVVARTPANHDFDLVYGYIVNHLGSSVHVVTTSWGICEREIKGTSSLSIDRRLFAQAAAEGQHWFSASGDNGTDDCRDGGHAVSVDFPGSSPHVVSVGGTNLTPKVQGGHAIGWRAETVWQFSNSDGATGGGQSILYAKPAYQKGVTPNDGVRDVPDVALISDPINDGFWIALGGIVQPGWGGTSFAAPQWAGLLAIVEQRYRDGAIADPHARLYRLASSRAGDQLFHDITRGTNAVPRADDPPGFHGFPAGPGFDLSTGWGSFIGAPLVMAY